MLPSLQDELDAAVQQAYGWADPPAAPAEQRQAAAEARAAVDTLLKLLVALNAKPAAEEAAGTVRRPRPQFQTQQGEQAVIDVEPPGEAVASGEPVAASAASIERRPWLQGLPEQINAVHVLAAAGHALRRLIARPDSPPGRWGDRLPVILDTLMAIARAAPLDRRQRDGVAVLDRWLLCV